MGRSWPILVLHIVFRDVLCQILLLLSEQSVNVCCCCAVHSCVPSQQHKVPAVHVGLILFLFRIRFIFFFFANFPVTLVDPSIPP